MNFEVLTHPSADPSISRLFPLKPIGLNTPKVESLTSYIARLADAHNVKSSTLIRLELLPHLNTGSQHSYYDRANKMAYSGTLNDCTSTTREVIYVLENLTWVKNLQHTTIIPWDDSIQNFKLARRYRAWCTECYKECIQNETPLYDQLLWALTIVKACPIHRTVLHEHCQNCNERVPFLGHIEICTNCLNPLTHSKCLIETDETQIEIAHKIGQLLEFTSSIKQFPSRQLINKAINHCVSVFFHGSRTTFAKRLGLSVGYANQLLCDKHSISLPVLINSSLYTGISIVDLIYSDYDHDTLVKKYGTERTNHKSKPITKASLNAEKSRKKVKLRRITFNNSQIKISATIKEKIQESFQLVVPLINPTLSSADCHTIELLLEASIAQGKGESITEIARRLNCTAYHIKSKFPTQYAELIHVNTNFKTRIRERLQFILDNEVEIPTITEISNELGVSETTLRRHGRELCKELYQKRIKLAKEQGNVKIYTSTMVATNEITRKILESALQEYPPPSFSNVQRRIGLSDRTIREKFAELTTEIGQRFLRYAQEQREVMNEQIRNAVIELTALGVYPSMNVLWKTLGFRINTPWRIKVRMEILKELGIDIRTSEA